MEQCRMCDKEVEEGVPFCEECDPENFICSTCGGPHSSEFGIPGMYGDFICQDCHREFFIKAYKQVNDDLTREINKP